MKASHVGRTLTRPCSAFAGVYLLGLTRPGSACVCTSSALVAPAVCVRVPPEGAVCVYLLGLSCPCSVGACVYLQNP